MNKPSIVVASWKIQKIFPLINDYTDKVFAITSSLTVTWFIPYEEHGNTNHIEKYSIARLTQIYNQGKIGKNNES